MKMGCRGFPCIPRKSDDVPPFDFLSLPDVDSRKMPVQCLITVAVVDDDVFAVSFIGGDTGIDPFHDTRTGGADLGTGLNADIDAGMVLASTRERVDACSEC